MLASKSYHIASALAKSNGPIVAAASATFSSQSKEALFDQIIAAASEIKDYNYKSYFVRRSTEDKANAADFSEGELEERLAQMQRIKTVQNLYVKEPNVVETKIKTQ